MKKRKCKKKRVNKRKTKIIMGGIRMIGDKWLSIRNDRKKGMSYSEIGRKCNIDRRTAKK